MYGGGERKSIKVSGRCLVGGSDVFFVMRPFRLLATATSVLDPNTALAGLGRIASNACSTIIVDLNSALNLGSLEGIW